MSTVIISAQEVNKLRSMTGAGMMDCKKALQEANGNFEIAIELLRKKGQKVSAARAENQTGEGIVLTHVSDDGKEAKILSFACETEPVSKVKDFRDLAHSILKSAVKHNVTFKEEVLNLLMENGRTVNENILDLTGKIGEKIIICDYYSLQGEKIVSYVHSNGKIGVLVALKNVGLVDVSEVGKDVAMQIAAMKPLAVDKDGIDPKIVERELEIGKEQARAEGKPEAMLEKIAQGKLNKFFKDNTLLNQDFVKDPTITIAQYLNSISSGLTVEKFIRVQIG
jgi:elongation factor Ts